MRLFLNIVWLLEIPRRKVLVKLPAVLGVALCLIEKLFCLFRFALGQHFETVFQA